LPNRKTASWLESRRAAARGMTGRTASAAVLALILFLAGAGLGAGVSGGGAGRLLGRIAVAISAPTGPDRSGGEAVALVRRYVTEAAAHDWAAVNQLLAGEALQAARYTEPSAAQGAPETVAHLTVKKWADYGPELTVVEATVVTTGGLKPAGQINWQRYYCWVLSDSAGRHIVHMSENPPALDAMDGIGKVPAALNLVLRQYIDAAAAGNMRTAAGYLAGRALATAVRDPEYRDTKVHVPAGSVSGLKLSPIAAGRNSEIVEASYSVARPGMRTVSLRLLAACVRIDGRWFIERTYLAGQG